MRQMSYRILVVDDDKGLRNILNETLSAEGYKVLAAATGSEGLMKVGSEELNLVLLDYKLPDMTGIDVLREIKRRKPNLPVVMMTAHASYELAVDAVKLGAYNFLDKPVDEDRLLATVRNALDQDSLQRQVRALQDAMSRTHEMVGVSEPMRRVYDLITKVAPSSASVLVLGESGVGKELVARDIHNQSSRAGKPFVKLNCAAIPNELVESELFGHEKGAFTSAVAAKPGKVELADSGTLFLDEVGDMNLLAQAKLLRFLQEGEFERVGGTELQKVDVRVLAASNKNLEAEVQAGRFREDLFYRLNVVTIVVPPLRERPEDIPLLAEHFIRKHGEKDGLAEKALANGAAKLLSVQAWPGNVRELENTMRRIAVLVEDPVLTADNIVPFLKAQSFERGPKAPDDLRDARQAFERDHILGVLAKVDGNVSEAARRLGIERSHLYRKLRELNIDQPTS